MTKDEKIKLLTDETKTDNEVANILGLSVKYLPILRRRLSIKKTRGNKKGTIRTSKIIQCSVCKSPVKKIESDNDRQFCSRTCMYESKEYRQKLSNINKEYMLTSEYSLSKTKEDAPEFRKYSNKVQTLTRKCYALYREEINPMNLPRGRAGEEGVYHLDHIIPVRYGFDNGIDPDIISRKENLQMMPWRDNIMKGDKLC